MRGKSIALLALTALVVAGLGCGRDEEGGAEFPMRSPQANAAEGRSVLIVIAGDGYRDEETYVTRDALNASGAAVTLAAPSTAEARAAIMGSLTPDVALAEASAEEYDAIVFVGWEGGPGLAGDEAALALASDANAAGKVVAGIGQGIGILEAVGLVQPLEGGSEAATDQSPAEESPVGPEGGEPTAAPESADSAEPPTTTDVSDGQPEGEGGQAPTTGLARRAVPATPEQLEDENFEPETVVRDGRVITAVGPRDAMGFAHAIVQALAEAAPSAR